MMGDQSSMDRTLLKKMHSSMTDLSHPIDTRCEGDFTACLVNFGAKTSRIEESQWLSDPDFSLRNQLKGNNLCAFNLVSLLVSG